MLNPTRHGARALNVTLSSACSAYTIPLAESSRHALLRAKRQQRYERLTRSASRSNGEVQRTFSRGYASAARAVEEEYQPSFDDWRDRDRGPNHDLSRPQRPPDPPPLPRVQSQPPDESTDRISDREQPDELDLDQDQTPISSQHRHRTARIPPSARKNPMNSPAPGLPPDFHSNFVHLVRADAVDAFLCFSTARADVVSHLQAEHFDFLYDALAKLYRKGPLYLRPIARCDAHNILCRLRRQIESLPAVQRRHGSPPKAGENRLRGRRLFDFLRLCVWLKCPDIAKDTFREVVPRQNIKDVLKQELFETYAVELARIGQQEVMIDSFTDPLFPSQPPLVPIQHWSPYLISIISQAFLISHNPLPVARIIEHHFALGGKMSGAIYRHLFQSLIMLGQHQEAEDVRLFAREAGFNDKGHTFGEQFAILRAQRSLGFDPALEERVLKDIGRHPPESAAKLLHLLIRLRMDNNDLDGALKLFGMFDMRIWDEAKTETLNLPPLHTTLTLAFELIARRHNAEQLQTWWSLIVSSPVFLKDRLIASLVRGLGALDLIEDAYRMLHNYVFGKSPEGFAWRLPDMSEVSVHSMNALIQYMAKKEGMIGLMRATNLMQDADIPPNDHTFTAVIQAIRENVIAEPIELCRILESLLKRSRDVKAHIGHVDSILAEAVRSMHKFKGKKSLAVLARADLRDPSAGLVPIGQFGKLLESKLDNLRARGVQSRSSSMESRLRFEAKVGRVEEGVPTAQTVFDKLLGMGYRLNQRHLLALMHGYAEAGNIDEVAAVPGIARRMGIVVNRAMLVVLVTSWARCGKMREAGEAYERLRELGKDNPNKGLNLAAITLFISCLRRAGRHTRAADVTMKDMVDSDIELDDKAIKVGAAALLMVKDGFNALGLLERRKTPALDWTLRRLARKCRTLFIRKTEEFLDTEDDRKAIRRLEEMLADDAQARPYISQRSMFSAPPTDQAMRKVLIDGKRVPVSGQDGKPSLRSLGGVEQIVSELWSNDLPPLSPEYQELLKEHRRRLENELLDRRFVGRTRKAQDNTPRTFSTAERQLIQHDLNRFERSLRVYGKSGRRRSGSRGRRAHVYWRRRVDPNLPRQKWLPGWSPQQEDILLSPDIVRIPYRGPRRTPGVPLKPLGDQYKRVQQELSASKREEDQRMRLELQFESRQRRADGRNSLSAVVDAITPGTEAAFRVETVDGRVYIRRTLNMSFEEKQRRGVIPQQFKPGLSSPVFDRIRQAPPSEPSTVPVLPSHLKESHMEEDLNELPVTNMAAAVQADFVDGESWMPRDARHKTQSKPVDRRTRGLAKKAAAAAERSGRGLAKPAVSKRERETRADRRLAKLAWEAQMDVAREKK